MSEQKGLSILIPVYNVDIRKLVNELARQGQQSEIPFEIICFDDFSDSSYKQLNSEITRLEKVEYKEFPFNIGRSKIRNQLAKSAQYSHLLFLDCDSSIPSSLFIQNYIHQLYRVLVIGGREYRKELPEKDFILHWTIGKAREQRNAIERNKNPYQSFMSNNFLIERKLFLNIGLDETLEGYGHEDTKFGYELNKLKVPVYHIDNPVIHEELDSSVNFLNKTKEGIKNLYKISKEGYGTDTKLFKAYSFLVKSGAKSIFLFFYSLLKKKIEKNLLSDTPSLFYFDLFKLYYLLKESKNNSNSKNQVVTGRDLSLPDF